MMKKRVVPLFMMICLLSGCAAKGAGAQVTTGEIGVIKDENFGSIYIDGSIDQFQDHGFAFGDSVDVAFDNGVSLEDVPYYSGYFGSDGRLLLCGYQGYEHVLITRKTTGGTWDEFHMTPTTKVTVTLHEAGKYLKMQETYNVRYTDDRNDYSSDEVFANFRELKGGELASGLFYRSASPCDNEYNRASYANELAEEAGVRFVLNLSDSEEEYEGYKSQPDFTSVYYDGLSSDGKVLFMDLDANYQSDAYTKAVADALLDATESDGPCLVHCVEGKDRTGFVCTLVLALAGADYEEITTDYMITYANYYGVTKEKDPDRYDIFKANADGFLYFLCGAEEGTPMDTLDFCKGAENYLRQGGLSEEDVQIIESYLRGE